MKLSEYLEFIGIKPYSFSALLKVSSNTAYSWTTGKRRPSYKKAQKIEKITKGKVPIEEFGYKKREK